jgi:fimbrial chaperone protein
MVGKKGTALSRAAIAFGGLIVATGIAGPASAGSFKVDPVQVTLPADRQVASLTITNGDAAPVSIRVQALAWSQPGGIDRYDASTNAIVSPPIFTIPSGGTQIVRVGLKDRDAARAYRLIAEEIPRQKPADGQVQVLLRLNLPLYVLPKSGGKPAVSWSASRSADGAIVIRGHNFGSLHQQVTQLSAELDGKTEVLTKQLGVVLPGSERTWKTAALPQLRTGQAFVLKVRSPAGDAQTQVVLETR